MENGRKTEKPSICLKELRRKKREKKNVLKKKKKKKTSQRDMHQFLSVEIFCGSEGEAMLNKIQNLIHVTEKVFFLSTVCEEETALICFTLCLLTDFC